MKTYHLHNDKQRPVTPQEQSINHGSLMLPWGKYKGWYLRDVPDDYLILLEDGFASLRRGKPGAEATSLKVPSYLMEAARMVLKGRGYTRRGERWTR